MNAMPRGQLRQLTRPTISPIGRRIPGLKIDHPRQLALMHALVRFAHIAAGSTFTTAEIYPHVIKALAVPPKSFRSPRSATTLQNCAPRA